jgi:excisionase family DNA binding protein
VNDTTKQVASKPTSYLAPDEIRAELRVSPATVYRLLQAGDLPSLRILGTIRVRRDAYEHWKEAQEQLVVSHIVRRKRPAAGPSERGESDGTQAKENSAYGCIIPD